MAGARRLSGRSRPGDTGDRGKSTWTSPATPHPTPTTPRTGDCGEESLVALECPMVGVRPSVVVRLLGPAVLATSCASSAPAPTPPTPDNAPTITITSAGVSPNAVTVALGGRVLFVNQDTVSHNISSDPHPERDQCPEINQVGFLQPGDSRET